MMFGIALANEGSVDDVLTWTDRIEAVTAADVKQAAEHVLRIERSVTGLLLPEELARQAETGDTETVDTQN
jgi:zinc protease